MQLVLQALSDVNRRKDLGGLLSYLDSQFRMAGVRKVIAGSRFAIVVTLVLVRDTGSKQIAALRTVIFTRCLGTAGAVQSSCSGISSRKYTK